MSRHEPLVDGFGRVHTNLRISVTDRCNIRCFYCMPTENVAFKPRTALLAFEEIERFVRVVARHGVDKVRLTGGEPLVRQGMDSLVAHLVAIPGIRDVALTTNAVLLADQAESLFRAGLGRLNISLDAMDREKFQLITRRDEFDRVMQGILAAKRAGFEGIKINAVAIRGITEDEVIPLAQFASEHDFEVRFIEFMPLDADDKWHAQQVLDGDEIRDIVEEHLGPLVPLPVRDPSQPATDYQLVHGGGRIGFINPVSQPFCGNCNRLRLTAEGMVRNCLFSTTEWDAKAVIRRGGTDEQLIELVRSCIGAKRAAHGINTSEFERPQRSMYQIGG